MAVTSPLTRADSPTTSGTTVDGHPGPAADNHPAPGPGADGQPAPGGHPTATADGQPAPGPRSEARELAILDAAVDVLAEVGYERLTMDHVAERAHASKATIYRHFAGKAQLVAEAVQRRCGGPETMAPDTGSLRGDLLAIMGEACRSMRGDQGRLVIGLAHAIHDDPELGAIVRQQLLEAKSSVTEPLVDRAVARGELPEGTDPRVLGEVAPALLLHQLLWGLPLDRRFVTHVVDHVLLPLLTRTDRPSGSQHHPNGSQHHPNGREKGRSGR